MSDQNDQQNPTEPKLGLPKPPTDSSLKAAVKGLWSKYSIFFIVVGLLIIVAKFGDILIGILSWQSKRAVEDAKKVDSQLRSEENAANKQANELIKQAEDLSKNKEKVDENWHKKGR